MTRRPTTAMAVLTGAALAASTTATAWAAPPDHAKGRGGGPPAAEDSYPVDGDFTDTWTRTAAATWELDDSNTLPLLEESPVEPMSDEVWVWDTWPLTGLDTRTENVRGWKIAFSLTADKDLDFVERHWTAEIGYFISRDGRDWQYQGDLFPEDVDPPGQREWAGSSVIVGDRVYHYYTASGTEGAADGDLEYFRQRLAVASARIVAGPDGVEFTDWTDHEIIAAADGELYQSLEQSAGSPIIYGFRDPWVFRNPDDGEIYMLFEGNTPGARAECDEDDLGPGPYPPLEEGAGFYNGNIGLAASEGGSMTEFELLPPIMSANCVNQQLERPHATFRGGDVYLWTITHKFTFAPALQDTGSDALVGFVGPSLRSDYEPLNGSGLVLSNPPENNTQSYSWYVMPGGFVESFLDNVEGEYIGSLGGTAKIAIQGQARTKLVKVFDTPFIR
ncbi:glycoside hydrolase family 68 protein [Aquipuribacter nitratireducens]|uniref:Glycoside hydrolase family 68 protein n=1 Tax=Aquipuribacter nitratireducens TaxID=650104 RepID=A0ABW0GRK2_9MICO